MLAKDTCVQVMLVSGLLLLVASPRRFVPVRLCFYWLWYHVTVKQNTIINIQLCHWKYLSTSNRQEICEKTFTLRTAALAVAALLLAFLLFQFKMLASHLLRSHRMLSSTTRDKRQFELWTLRQNQTWSCCGCEIFAVSRSQLSTENL